MTNKDYSSSVLTLFCQTVASNTHINRTPEALPQFWGANLYSSIVSPLRVASCHLGISVAADENLFNLFQRSATSGSVLKALGSDAYLACVPGIKSLYL